MKRIIPMFCLAVGSSFCAKSQLYIDNATFTIESGATVTVQGDLTSNTNISGTGKILLKGTTVQNVNMNNGGTANNAYTIPNLEIDNAANVVLKGNLRVGSSLAFTNGKVQAGDFNFTIANGATLSGMAAGKFIETNGIGMVQREIGSGAASDVMFPTGTGTAYTPIMVSHSGGTYNSPILRAQAKEGKSPNAHIRTESYTNVYWPVASTGISGGNFTATGTYADGNTGYTGTETDIVGMGYNGSEWSRTGGAQSSQANTVTAQLTGTSGQLFGMNRFLLLNSRVLLQGASPVNGIMNDGLRANGNVIPTTEPYRGAPYSFPIYNGGTQEVAAASVFDTKAVTNDNLVDWIFVELRSTTAGSTPTQTRSVFVQRDGDVVDIDGVSPVYFKNLDPNNFTVTIRHRNHLAISTNNAGGIYKGLAIAPTPSLDFTNLSAGSILGTAGANYAATGGYNIMYGGNAFQNGTANYLGINTDRAELLVIMGNANNAPTPVRNITSPADYITYGRGDLNFDKKVDYLGLSPDRSFLLGTVLGGQPSPNPSKQQILPN